MSPVKDEKDAIQLDDVTVFGDHDPILNLGDSSDPGIGGSVGLRQLRSVHDVVSQLDQQCDETSRQLRVGQQAHLRR